MLYFCAVIIIIAVIICYCCLTISPRNVMEDDKEQAEILKEWKRTHKK